MFFKRILKNKNSLQSTNKLLRMPNAKQTTWNLKWDCNCTNSRLFHKLERYVIIPISWTKLILGTVMRYIFLILKIYQKICSIPVFEKGYRKTKTAFHCVNKPLRTMNAKQTYKNLKMRLKLRTLRDLYMLWMSLELQVTLGAMMWMNLDNLKSDFLFGAFTYVYTRGLKAVEYLAKLSRI